jgi:hypothetical protein
MSLFRPTPPLSLSDSNTSISQSVRFSLPRKLVTLDGDLSDHVTVGTAIPFSGTATVFSFPTPTDGVSQPQLLFECENHVGPSSIINVSVTGGNPAFTGPHAFLANPPIHYYWGATGKWMIILQPVEIVGTLGAPVYINMSIV